MRFYNKRQNVQKYVTKMQASFYFLRCMLLHILSELAVAVSSQDLLHTERSVLTITTV